MLEVFWATMFCLSAVVIAAAVLAFLDILEAFRGSALPEFKDEG